MGLTAAACLLHAFIDDAGLFAPDEAPSAMIAHALVDGHDDDAILATLAHAFGADEMLPKRDEIVHYAHGSIFSVLRAPTVPW